MRDQGRAASGVPGTSLPTRAWARTIWHRGAIPATERKYATPLKRVMLPMFDSAVIVLGMLGLSTGGFTALKLTLPTPVPLIIYGVLAATGAICLVGISFPRLWALELAGKSLMLGALLVLLGAFVQAGATVPGHAGFVAAPMVAWGILILLLRLWIIGVEIGKPADPPRGERPWNG